MNTFIQKSMPSLQLAMYVQNVTTASTIKDSSGKITLHGLASLFPDYEINVLHPVVIILNFN